MFSLCFFLLNWAPERVSATQRRQRLVLSPTPTLSMYKKMIQPSRTPPALQYPLSKPIMVTCHNGYWLLLFECKLNLFSLLAAFPPVCTSFKSKNSIGSASVSQSTCRVWNSLFFWNGAKKKMASTKINTYISWRRKCIRAILYYIFELLCLGSSFVIIGMWFSLDFPPVYQAQKEKDRIDKATFASLQI